jgi:hypothetical protein
MIHRSNAADFMVIIVYLVFKYLNFLYVALIVGKLSEKSVETGMALASWRGCTGLFEAGV